MESNREILGDRIQKILCEKKVEVQKNTLSQNCTTLEKLWRMENKMVFVLKIKTDEKGLTS